MRFLFKTDYDQDIGLFRHGGDRFWYGLLLAALLLAPLALEDFFLGELSFVFIYAIAGVGMMLLFGYTGLISLGHAAFLGIGAYANAFLVGQGWPFVVTMPLAGVVAAAVGFVVGLPALRVTGVYLAIATFAFATIVEEVFARWETVTKGHFGLPVEAVSLFGLRLKEDWQFYYLTLAVLVAVMLAAVNLLRSPTGRAFVAVRDSEVAAQSMGVNLLLTKATAFAISAGFTGLAGALFGHKLGYLSPDAFNVLMSITLLLMVAVGGLGSLHGVVFGALFVGALPQLIAILRDYLPEEIARQPSLEPGLFGLILVLIVLFEPRGIYGRWLKIKLYFQLFPLYKRATFKRQKAYLKSERMR
jgi:branched-chain amino acid transport system permease protein